tara:strand:+ start:296 stop:514 length:219 start_codon:yes stop_codon:yes gene_type:complete
METPCHRDQKKQWLCPEIRQVCHCIFCRPAANVIVSKYWKKGNQPPLHHNYLAGPTKSAIVTYGKGVIVLAQ